MSRRNDYDYFDLDNFDDSIDSREYRRRQQPVSYTHLTLPTKLEV